MQNAVRLASLTNSVGRLEYSSGSTICKHYCEQGLRNGFQLPLSRVLVETRLLEGLRRLIGADRDSLAVSEIVQVDSHGSRLYMSDLGGVPLCHRPESEWPAPDAWASLGRLSARLERASDEIARSVPRDVWVQQDALRRLVVDRRIRNVTSEQTCLLAGFGDELPTPGVICLGDLCFANLLACDGRLGVVDFEFAHIGYAGRDVGRLVAQLNAEAARDPVAGRILVQCRESLLTGFADRGGNLNYAHRWAAILECHYSNPDRMNSSLAPQGRC